MMIINFTYSSTSIVWEYLLVFCAQVLLYILAAGSMHIFYSFWKRVGVGAPVDPGPLRPKQISHEIRWSVVTCGVMSAYVYASLATVAEAQTPNVGYVLLQVLGFLVAYDFYFYVTHRLLHSRWLIRFHARHHQSVRATPWACLNMHPVEAAINYLPYLIFAFAVPVSVPIFLGIYVYLLFGIASGHGNFNLANKSRSKLVRDFNSFHQRHHSSGDGNFGLAYTHWDSVFGTVHK